MCILLLQLFSQYVQLLTFLELLWGSYCVIVAGQAELEIRPSGDSFVRALDSNIVFTCDVANIGAQLVDIELRWFNQHGVEIVDVAARGRLLAIVFYLLIRTDFNIYVLGHRNY